MVIDDKDRELVGRLRNVSPSTLGHLRDSGLIAGLEPIVRPIRLAGVAATIQATEYGAPGLIELAQESGPGSVIVISRPEGSRRTNFGGIVAARLVDLGINGVIVDGRITDYEQIVALGLPVFHRGLTPIVGRRTAEPAVVNVPLRVDGVVINPGDFVFGDSDGVGVLSPYEVDSERDLAARRRGATRTREIPRRRTVSRWRGPCPPHNQEEQRMNRREVFIMGFRLRSRRGALAGIVLASALALAACAPAASAGDATQRAIGDTLKVGVHGPTLVSIDPEKSTLRTGSEAVAWAIYPRLTELDAEGTLVPSSAVSWEQTTDTTWVFTLRPDVVYENGEAFDADVVAWNFQQLLDTNSGWIAASSFRKYIASVEATAADEVTFTTSSPFLQLPNALATIFYLEPTWAADHDPATEALGTGPYRLVSYTQENKAVLAASETYWGDEPEFTTVEVYGYAEEATRLAALKNGEIDATLTIDPVSIPDLQSATTLSVGGEPGQRIQTLQLNFNVVPFQDIRVRQALNYAIDREAITKSIYLGTTEPNRTQVISQWYVGYEPDAEIWPYDLDKAKELIAEAGYADGFTAEVNVPSSTYAGAEQAIQVIQQSWAELGITLTIDVLPSSAWSDKNLSADPSQVPDIIYWGIQYPNLISAYNLGSWRSDARTNDGALPNQTDFDAIVNQAFAATSEDEYIARVREGSQWLRDNAALVYLWDQPQTYAYDKTKLDWTPRYDDWFDFVNIKKATA